MSNAVPQTPNVRRGDAAQQQSSVYDENTTLSVYGGIQPPIQRDCTGLLSASHLGLSLHANSDVESVAKLHEANTHLQNYKGHKVWIGLFAWIGLLTKVITGDRPGLIKAG